MTVADVLRSVQSRMGEAQVVVPTAWLDVLFAAAGVVRCVRCDGRFVKNGKQKFCSARCANRAHSERFFEIHPPREYFRARAHARKQRKSGLTSGVVAING